MMDRDQYLHEFSSTSSSRSGYYTAFFGDPSDPSVSWVPLGGHHLGINATLHGCAETLAFAPTHLGVQPADATDEEGEECSRSTASTPTCSPSTTASTTSSSPC